MSQGIAEYTVTFTNNTPDPAEGYVGGWVHNTSPYSYDAYPTGAAYDVGSASASGDLILGGLIASGVSSISSNYIGLQWEIELPAYSTGEFTIKLIPQKDGNNGVTDEAMISGSLDATGGSSGNAQMSASVWVYDSVESIATNDCGCTCGCGGIDPIQGRLKSEVTPRTGEGDTILRHFSPEFEQSPLSLVLVGLNSGSTTVDATLVNYTSTDGGITIDLDQIGLGSVSGTTSSGDYRVSMQPTTSDFAGLDAGVYEVSFTSAGWTGGSTSILTAIFDPDKFDDEFGGGWGISGFSRLAVQDRNLDGLVNEDDIDISTHFAVFEDARGIVFPIGQESDGDSKQRILTYDNVADLFALTDREGNVQAYNQAGLLVSEKDKAGNERVYAYDDMDGDSEVDEIVSITDPDGRETEFGYTGSLVTSITDGWGRVTTLVRNLDDEIESIVLPDPDLLDAVSAPFQEFTYNGDGSIATKTSYPDPDDLLTAQTESYTYDVDGRLESIEYPDGRSYDLQPALQVGTLASASDPVESVSTIDGVEVRTRYTNSGDVLQVVKNYSASPTDPYTENVTTTYTYWADGDYDYVASDYVSGLAVGQVKSITQSDPDGSGGDSAAETQYWYDHTTGRVIKTQYADTSYELFAYDVSGNLTEVTDRRGFTTLFDYDGNDNLIRIQAVIGATDTLNLVSDPYNLLGDDPVTTWEYDTTGSDILGLPTAQVDARGVRTELTYTTAGNIATVTDDVGGSTESTQYFVYDASDRLARRYSPLWDPTAHTTLENTDEHQFDEFVYDAWGRISEVYGIDPDGDAGPASPASTTYEYDGLGRVAFITDTLGRITEYVYALDGLSATVNQRDSVSPHAILSSMTEEYDAFGRVETSIDALNRETTYGYDALGRQNSVTLPDPDGATPTLSSPVLQTEYDALGRVTRTIGARGEETTYAYGNFGREITVTLPDADGPSEYVYYTTTLSREYDALGNLIEEVDANSNTTTYEYDDLNRLVKVYAPDPDGGGPLTYALTEFEYDKVGNLRFTTDPLGNVTEYQYDARSRLVKVIQPDPDGAGGQAAPETDYEYDDAGQLISVTDPLDRVTEYDYDDLGRLILVTLTDPDGGGPLAAPEIGYTYDAAGRKLTMTDPRGNVTAYAYDDLDNLVELTQPDPDGGGGLAAPVTSYTYDASGNMLTATSPLAKVTSYAYDFLGRTTSVTDSLSGVTSFTYDSNSNRLTLTDPETNTTSWTYDAHNRVTQETNALSQSRSFVYDAAGNLTQRTDRLGRVIFFDYDNLYRKTQEQWWANSTFPSSSVYASTEGSSTNEVQYVGFYEYSGSFTSGTFTLTFDGQTTSAIAYDADAEDVQVALEALSNIGVGDVSVTMPINYGYHQEWEVTFTGALAGTDVAQITVDASAVYNGFGTPTENESTYYEGNSTNEVQEVTISNADGGTFSLTFTGQTTAALDWDATAGEVETALEALSNIDAVSVSGSAGGPFTITFEGGLAGENIELLVANTSALTNANLQRILTFEYDLAGQLTAANDPAAVNYFTYDDLGRVTNETMTFAGYLDTITLDQDYDVAGNRTQSEWAFGTTEALTSTFVYDNLNRLTQLTRESDEEASYWHRVAFSYNKLGQFTELNRFVGDNTTPIAVADTDYTYDGLNRLTSILHTTGMTTWAGYDYVYDAASRITEIDSFLDGLSQYDYDDTDQLIDADHTGSTDETYDYDANGNRDTGYTTGTNNQLQSDGIYNYTYDAEGNRLTRANISTSYVTEYTWDHRNRLVAVTEKDDMSNVLSVVENSYDVFNRWIRRSVDSDGPGGTAAIDSFFAYEGNQLSLEINGDDGSDLSHIYSWGPNVDQLIADITHGSTPNFGLSDHLGTPRDFVAYDSGLTDTVDTGHRIYDSFGNLTFSTGITSFLGYTARPFEITIGLQYNLHRWYDAPTGRWMSEDPIGFAAGDTNVLRYVKGAVLSLIDPLGLYQDSTTTAMWAAGNLERLAQSVTDLEDSVEKYKDDWLGRLFGDDKRMERRLGEARIALAKAYDAFVADGFDDLCFEGHGTGLEGAISYYYQRKSELHDLELKYEGGGIVSEGLGPFEYIVPSRVGYGVLRLTVLRSIARAAKSSVDDFARAAAQAAKNYTQNPNSLKVVLGQTNANGVRCANVASHFKATYLKFPNWERMKQWMPVEHTWAINKAFLEQQIKAGKQFILSHDPSKAEGFFALEVEFLEQEGYRFVKDGWFWKAVK